MNSLQKHSLFSIFGLFLLVLGSFSCDDNGSKPKANNDPVEVIYDVPTEIRRIPHYEGAYTQGFLYADSLLYESTGLYENHARLYKINPYPPNAGEILHRVFAPYNSFTEGLALKDSLLVQLTYTWEKAFVYTYPDMVRVDSLTYEGQGWGLTSDQSRFIMSNGSDTLYFRDDDFNIIGKVNVTLEGEPLYQLNELEYVHGKVWANVWYSKSIYEINPQTGCVTKVIDCQRLVTIVNPPGSSAVLNGIAYNDDAGTYFLTGKYWKYIFEVVIP